MHQEYLIVTVEAKELQEAHTPVLEDAVGEGFKPMLMTASEGKIFILVGRSNNGRV